jgi:hypothetical protein
MPRLGRGWLCHHKLRIAAVRAGVARLPLGVKCQQSFPPFHELAQIGGSGASPFAETCKHDSFLTGLALRTADDVDAVMMVCLARDGSRQPGDDGMADQGVALSLCGVPRIFPLSLALRSQPGARIP